MTFDVHIWHYNHPDVPMSSSYIKVIRSEFKVTRGKCPFSATCESEIERTS